MGISTISILEGNPTLNGEGVTSRIPMNAKRPCLREIVAAKMRIVLCLCFDLLCWLLLPRLLVSHRPIARLFYFLPWTSSRVFVVIVDSLHFLIPAVGNI